MSNEKVIRDKCIEFLKKEYQDHDVKICEEFGTHMTRSRADVVAITHNDVISVEIKSDKDTFARLEKQLRDYLFYSTRIYVALDEAHYEKFRNIDGFHHVGILTFKDDVLELKRTAHEIKPDYFKVIFSDGLKAFLQHFKNKTKMANYYSAIYTVVTDIFTYRETFEISKKLFIQRARGYSLDFDKSLIADFDYKQQRFNRWIDPKNWSLKPDGKLNFLQVERLED